MKRIKNVLFPLVFVPVLAVACSSASWDLASIKKDIASQYNSRDGVVVTEVFLELSGGSPTGWVKFRVGADEYYHSCTTTVYDNGQFSWQCAP